MIVFLNFILLFAVFFDWIGPILDDAMINYQETIMEGAIHDFDALYRPSIVGWEYEDGVDDNGVLRYVFKPNPDYVSYIDINGNFDVYFSKAKDGEIEINGSEGEGFMYIGRNRPDSIISSFSYKGIAGRWNEGGTYEGRLCLVYQNIFTNVGNYYIRRGKFPVDTTVVYENGIVDTVAMIEYIKSVRSNW